MLTDESLSGRDEAFARDWSRRRSRCRRSGPRSSRSCSAPTRSTPRCASMDGYARSARCRCAARSSPPPSRPGAQPLGNREHRSTHRQCREDLVGKMRRRLRHVSCVAGGARRAALARERDQEIVSAVPAAGTRETVGQDAAFKVAAKLPPPHTAARVTVIGGAAADSGIAHRSGAAERDSARSHASDVCGIEQMQGVAGKARCHIHYKSQDINRCVGKNMPPALNRIRSRVTDGIRIASLER